MAKRPKNIATKVDFRCPGPYLGKEQESLHPATMTIYDPEEGKFFCDYLNRRNSVCLKNSEKLPYKICPFTRCL